MTRHDWISLECSSLYSISRAPRPGFLGFGGGVCPIGRTLNANVAGHALGLALLVALLDRMGRVHAVAANMGVFAVLVRAFSLVVFGAGGHGSSIGLGAGGLALCFVLAGEGILGRALIRVEDVEPGDLRCIPSDRVVGVFLESHVVEIEMIQQDGREGITLEKVVKVVGVVEES